LSAIENIAARRPRVNGAGAINRREKDHKLDCAGDSEFLARLGLARRRAISMI
jgi:hypothetical protein